MRQAGARRDFHFRCLLSGVLESVIRLSTPSTLTILSSASFLSQRSRQTTMSKPLCHSKGGDRESEGMVPWHSWDSHQFFLPILARPSRLINLLPRDELAM